MNEADGRIEIIFLMTMLTAMKMFAERLISKEEYVAFDTKMKEKYSPKIGGLFSNINLL